MGDDNPQSAGDENYVGFEKVLENELKQIAEGRAVKAEPKGDTIYRKARSLDLSALALSGGGIRSAVFNLGFIQGMANRRVLHGFDYLSTVSGGGYVGGWLSALLKREGGDKPVDEAKVGELAGNFIATPPAVGVAKDSGFPMPESTAVRFLRRYADYLTPRLGLSGDTLALVGLALRNVMVIQMLLVSLLVAVFAFLMLSARTSAFFTDWLTPIFHGGGALVIALVAALMSQRGKRGRGEAGMGKPNSVIIFGTLLPTLFSGLLLAVGLEMANTGDVQVGCGAWIAAPMLVYGLAWAFSLKSARAWVGMLGGAATLGVLLFLGAEMSVEWLDQAHFGYGVALGPAVMMVLSGLIVTVHLALAGPAISESSREWWARAGGQGLFLALIWVSAFAVLLFAPPLIQYGQHAALAGGGLWAALTWIGTRLAQGKDTVNGGMTWKDLAAKLAPWVFLLGLLGLVAWAFVACLPWVSYEGSGLAAMIKSYHASLAKGGAGMLAIIAAGASALFTLCAGFIDLNIFSAHSFYRNRLARTFMGASHKDRQPNAFTGFDPEDDLALATLAKQRPVHLINANLNLTGGEELAWQTRRGASFLFSPSFCGYNTATSLGQPIGGYRRTTKYGGGLSLATAVAVSGAAASPNMGFHTATSVAALLTAFNLRLARWCPNPCDAQWKKDSPRWSALPLFAELSGEADGRNPWLNISDGGHFDNLGIYELVRRRAALIVVTDVGADPDFLFDDLAMLVRKLSVDFGVALEIDEADLDAIRAPAKPPRFSKKHWAIGRIRYPDGCAPGYLIYVKSSLTAAAPVDIRQYHDTHPGFPHESTADQWFDEDQFEAYRHLGQDIAEKLFGCLLEQEPGATPLSLSADQLVRALFEKLSAALPESKKGD